MSVVFDPKRFSVIIWILGAILFVKVLWVVIGWIVPLPLQYVEHQSSSLRHTLRYKYRLASDTKLRVPQKKEQTKAPPPAKRTLSPYKLVGIYSKGSYALAILVRGTKSYILATGDNGGTLEGYHLKDVNISTATFENSDETVSLRLFDRKILPKAKSKSSAEEKKTNKKDKSGIIDDGDTKIVDRSLIQEYVNNPDKVWQDIGLYEVQHDGKLDGFKVRFVRKGSPFGKLGLQRGDIIRAINGEPIVDYATPMRMLRSADRIDDLSLTIERNQEEQELKYEVK